MFNRVEVEIDIIHHELPAPTALVAANTPLSTDLTMDPISKAGGTRNQKILYE